MITTTIQMTAADAANETHLLSVMDARAEDALARDSRRPGKVRVVVEVDGAVVREHTYSA
jgi:hypothetical protein